MDIYQHSNCVGIIGKPEDLQDGSCNPLPISRYADQNGQWVVSYWKPNKEELELLKNGGTIAVHIKSTAIDHPVIGLEALPHDEDESKYFKAFTADEFKAIKVGDRVFYWDDDHDSSFCMEYVVGDIEDCVEKGPLRRFISLDDVDAKEGFGQEVITGYFSLNEACQGHLLPKRDLPRLD